MIVAYFAWYFTFQWLPAETLSTIRFDQSRMREHYQTCFETELVAFFQKLYYSLCYMQVFCRVKTTLTLLLFYFTLPSRPGLL